MAFTILKGSVLAIMAGCFLFQLWSGQALDTVGDDYVVRRCEHRARYWISIFLQGSSILLSILWLILD